MAAMCVGVGEERKREGGKDRRVYHQVRVRRERYRQKGQSDLV